MPDGPDQDAATRPERAVVERINTPIRLPDLVSIWRLAARTRHGTCLSLDSLSRLEQTDMSTMALALRPAHPFRRLMLLPRVAKCVQYRMAI
jgi:hypothetical protein